MRPMPAMALFMSPLSQGRLPRAAHVVGGYGKTGQAGAKQRNRVSKRRRG